MTDRPLFKRKSAYTKRRMIIFFILSTIIAVSVMTGFSSGLNSDGTIYTADGQRIVMWKDMPQSGTPEDYDLISNVQYTAQRIYLSPYFRGVTSGKVVANVGMGIKYTQNVDNIRVVKGKTIFAQAISSSSLKSVAEQRYYIGDEVFLRPSVSISGGNASFADNISKFDKDAYYQAYGVVPNELTKLKIDNTTILSVRDDNAGARAAAKNSDGNSSADGDGSDDTALSFDVPQSLVPDGDGNFSVTMELDPAESTKYSRNEVRTLAGADQNPLYYSVSVNIKFTSEWKPIAITTYDNYDIAIPVLGAMNCNTTLTEYFYDIDKEDGEIPEQEFFESRIGEIGFDTPPVTPQLSPADYLASAFSAYLDGSKTLDLEADIDIAGVKIDDLALSVDIGTMNIRAKLGRLAVEYAGDKVYITLNDIKGYLSVEKFESLMQNPALSSLIGGIAGELPDFGSLLGGDILATVFGSCTMTTTDGVTCIRLPFELAEGIDIDASLYINDEDLSLNRITGTVNAFGVDIALEAAPKSAKFPTVDETYVCLDGALDFIPDALETIKSTTYGITGTARFNDYSLDIDAYIERGENGVTVDATIGAFGLDIGIKYIDGEIYVSAGNINIHAAADELSDVMSALSELDLGIDFDLKKELGIDKIEKLLGITIELDSLDELKKLLPQTIPDWIAVVRSLEVTDGSLNLGAKLIGMPVRVGLTRANGKLDGVKLGMDLVVLDTISRLSVDLGITTPQKKTVTAPPSFIELTDLLDLIPAVQSFMTAKGFEIALDADVKNCHIDGNVTLGIDDQAGITASGAISALGQSVNVTYVSETVYLALDNIKLKLALSDLAPLLSKFGITIPATENGSIDLGALTQGTDISTVIDTVLGAVKSVEKKNGKVVINIEMAGVTASVMLGSDIKLDAEIGGINIGATVSALEARQPFAAPADGASYIDIGDLGDTIDAVMDIIKNKKLGGKIAVTVGGTTYNADLALDFSDGLKARVTVDAFGLEAVVIADSLADISSATVYAKIADIEVCGTVAELKRLISAITPALPEKVGDAVSAATGKLDALPDINAITPSQISAIIDGALGAISSLEQTADGLSAQIKVKETTVALGVNNGLSRITANMTAFGSEIAIELTDIAASAAPVAAPENAVSVAKLMPIVDAVVPLVDAKGFVVGINGTLDLDGDKSTAKMIDGTLTIALNPLKVGLDLTVADVKLGVVYDGQKLFVDIDGKLKLSCAATKDGIIKLINDIKSALSGAEETESVVAALEKASAFISKPMDLDIMSVLGDITLTDGVSKTGTPFVALGYKDMLKLSIGTKNETLSSLDIAFKVKNKDVTISSTVGVDGSGALSSLDVTYDFVNVKLDLSCNDNATVAAVNEADYTSVELLVGYVKPIMDIALKAMKAKTVSLDVNAKITLQSGKYLDIASKDLVISISEKTKNGKTTTNVGLSGQIILFAGTGADSETAIMLTFVNNDLYVKVGGIALKFNTEKPAAIDKSVETEQSTDTETPADTEQPTETKSKTDIDRLYDIMAKLLPDYLDAELAKLLGKADGASAFSDIGLIVEKITTLATPSVGAKTALKSLLDGYGGLGSDSTLKKLLGMVSLSTACGKLSVGADLGIIALTATPEISADEITKVGITANIFGADIYLSASNIALSQDETTITPPTNGSEYVSIVDFVEMIDNLVGTFTRRTEETATDGATTDNTTTGDASTDKTNKLAPITFKATDLDFTYAEKAENGTNITVKNMSGKPALMGKFTPHEVTVVKNGETVDTIEYSVTLEMHITLDMPSSAAKLGTLGLELYLIDKYPASPLAYLNYTEFYGNGDKNIGELVSIDADSVLQILAAAMDIVGVDPDTVQALLGKYRRQIDKGVFASMDIVGLDGLKATLNNLVKAIDEVTNGKEDIDGAIDKIKNAGSVDVLRGRMDGIKADIEAAVNHIKAAVEAFGKKTNDAEPTEPTEPSSSAISGKKFKSIVDGITFNRGAGTLSATVDNTLTTGADGEATVTVTEKDNTITGIDIDNLDVNTALVEGKIAFTSGETLTFSPEPTEAPSYSTYSDLANIKHLLFDVMNTANLKEFNIGGYDTSDSIKVKLDISSVSSILDGLAKLDIDIKYNIKVKLIENGTDEKGNPLYKTAAVVELIYENCKAKVLGIDAQVIPDCVTRLYFYDNVLYVQGISDWGDGKAVIGDVDVIYTATRYRTPGLVWTGYSYSDNFTSDYKVNGLNYVNVMYTVNEFMYMIKHDMKKFLEQFLFYLVPLSKDFSVGVNLQDTIVNMLPTSGSSDENKQNTQNTLARIFKGYTYGELNDKDKSSMHSLVIGLKELAGSDSLSDLEIDITAKNDRDDEDIVKADGSVNKGNIFNNYISKLKVHTSIQNGLVDVTLNAGLNNVKEKTDGKIASKGLAPTDVTTKGATFNHNGTTYINYNNFEYDTLFTLDGKLYETADGKLFTEHSKLVEAYRMSNGSDPITSKNSACQVDKPSDKGYVAGDTFWEYHHTYKLNDNCFYNEKYDAYTYYVGTNADKSQYVYRLDGDREVPVKLKSVIGDFLAEVVTDENGKITAVNNRDGGVNWTRPWQTDYENSLKPSTAA